MSTDHLHQPAGDGHTGRNDASDRIFEAYLIEALGGDAAPDQRRRILEQAAQRGLLGGDGAGLSGTREPGDEDPDPHTPMNTISRHDARTRRSLYSVATAAVLLLAVALIVMIATSTRSTPDSSNTVAVQPGPTDPRPTDPRPTDPPTGPDMANDPTEWPTYESYDIGVTPEVAAIKGDVVDATNAMGLDLLVRLREQDRDRNTMISPLSIGMVMHMLLNGATGTTAEEMRAALRLKDLPLDAVNVSNQMQKAIEERVRSKSTVRISNSLWANPEMQLERAFADTLHDYYGARVSPLESAAPINEWVNQQTNGMIPAIVDDQVVKSSEALIVNALYFKGTWADEFDPARTAPHEFRLPSGEKVKVPMMQHEISMDGIWPVRFEETFNAIVLQFSDRQLGVTLLVPNGDHTPDDIIKLMQAEGWRAMRSKFEAEQSYVQVPKMKISWSGELAGALQAGGMKRAFTPGAEFSGIAKDRTLRVSNVAHRTLIALDEKGAEGAAATIAPMTSDAVEGVTADRPFVLVVSDSQTGSILMIGVINDPR